MSNIGSPIQTLLVQTAQAQQTAAKKRDRERAGEAEAGRRLQDLVDIRVAGIEETDAIRKLPENDSEQAESEHRGDAHLEATRKKEPRIDLTA